MRQSTMEAHGALCKLKLGIIRTEHRTPYSTAHSNLIDKKNTMDVGARTQKEPLIELMKGSKNGGYLLSHNMQYHRRC